MNARPLRIAMVVPPWFDVPPRGYGGVEAVCADLTDGLVDRGNEVFLIAAGGSGTKARRFTSYDEPQWRRIGDLLPDVIHTATAGQVIDELDVDIVHDHTFLGPLLARGRVAPTMVTLHGPLGGEDTGYFALLSRTVSFVALSNRQREPAPGLNWLDTIPNGIPVTSFPYRPDKEDWVLFLGRCNPEKGMHLAIDAARAAGRRIRLAAKCNEPAEHEYFAREVAPRLGPDTEWLGEVHGEEKKELLASARCLLNPICWEEPFGLVMAEALSCGTPVVALERGSVPEVVTNGVTGVVCQRLDELPSAIDRVDRIEPELCRKDALARFRTELMAERYESAYRRLLARHPAVRPPAPAPAGEVAGA